MKDINNTAPNITEEITEKITEEITIAIDSRLAAKIAQAVQALGCSPEEFIEQALKYSLPHLKQQP